MGADVKNKQVTIYIDQTSAINSLDSLQKKADGFSSKIKEATEKQKQLLEQISKSQAASANIDTLKKNYSDLTKEIDNNKKKLAENTEEKKRSNEQLKLLNDRLEEAKLKQSYLTAEISKNEDAGKGTVKLQQQYAAVTREIELTTARLNKQTDSFDKASVEVDHLSKELAQANVQQKALTAEIRLADNATKSIRNAEKQYQSLNHTITANTSSLQKNKDAQSVIQNQIDRGLRPSLTETETLVKRLRNELIRMSEDAPGYAEKFEKFKSASSELDRLSKSMNGVERAQKSWLQEAKVVAFGVLIGNTVQSAVQAVGSYLSGIVTGNAKLSDSLADVEKATGLSSKAVEQLNKDLGKIDTRTATADLREIAIGLGQIGQEANKANVEAIDKIVVALGDEFGGGAREITTTLSVLRNNLQDIKTGNYAEDVGHIGNALNVLGAEGLATAPVVTDIANRIAGIAQTFGLSSGEILGLAATFQELGIETERGSTAVTKLFQKIGAEPAKFAKVAGISVKEFKNLVNTDMLGAFQAVAEGAKKAGSNNIVFSQILKELDADGSGAGEVLSKLGANAELLATKVNTSTNALKENGSITEEFAKKNTTLGAQLEKLSKIFSSLIQSKTLADVFASGVRGIIAFIGAIKAIPGFISENKTAIVLLTIGIATMNAAYIKAAVLITRDTALKIYNAIVTRGTAIATNIAIAAQLAYYDITALVTRQITLATAAQRLWSLALSLGAGPIGAIIVAVGALFFLIGNLTGAFKTLTAEQRLFNDLQKTALEDVSSQKAMLDTLTNSVNNNALSLDDRKKALAELIAISPAYLSGLTLENIRTQEGKKIIDEYVTSLDRMARAKATQALKEDLYKKSVEASVKAQQASFNVPKSAVGLGIESSMLAVGLGAFTGLGEKISANEEVKKSNDEIAALNAVTQKQIIEENKLYDAQQKKMQALKKDSIEYKNEQIKLNDIIARRNILMGLSPQAGISTNAPAASTPAVNPFGDPAKDKKAKKESDDRNRLLQQLKDFQFELSQVGKQADESEIARITKKYDELIKEAAKYHVDFIQLSREKDRAIAFLEAQELKKRQEELRKHAKLANEETYKAFKESAVQQGEDQKEIETKKYADGIINKRQLEEAIRRIDIETFAFQIGIAESFVGISQQASSDIVAFRKKKNKEEIEDAIKSRELKEALAKREQLAAAQVGVLKTPQGSQARLDAQLNLLKVEHDQELLNTELTNSEKEKLNEEYRQKQGELTIQFYLGQIEQTLNFFSQGLDILSKLDSAKSAKENAALQKELKNNEARKNSIRRLEESKVITAQEARRRITIIEKEEDAKKEALEKKQFERTKKIQITQAIINGALGITSILAAIPGPLDLLSLGVSRYVAIGLNIATTAAAIKEISSKKYGKGGRLTGPSHTSGGMPVINPVTGAKEAEVEGGEYILSKHTVANNRELADALLHSSMNNMGARIKPFWKNRPYRTLDYSKISERMYEKGGVYTAGASPAAAPAATTPASDPTILEALQQTTAVNMAMMGTIKNLTDQLAMGIDANVQLSKIDKARDRQNRMKADSEFK